MVVGEITITESSLESTNYPNNQRVPFLASVKTVQTLYSMYFPFWTMLVQREKWALKLGRQVNLVLNTGFLLNICMMLGKFLVSQNVKLLIN